MAIDTETYTESEGEGKEKERKNKKNKKKKNRWEDSIEGEREWLRVSNQRGNWPFDLFWTLHIAFRAKEVKRTSIL